jgi:hypothetical protein
LTKDVDLAGGGDDAGNAGGRCDVARGGREAPVRQGGAQTDDRLLDVCRLAAIDRHLGAVRRELPRDGAADALGRAGNQSA